MKDHETKLLLDYIRRKTEKWCMEEKCRMYVDEFAQNLEKLHEEEVASNQIYIHQENHVTNYNGPVVNNHHHHETTIIHNESKPSFPSIPFNPIINENPLVNLGIVKTIKDFLF